MRSSIESSRRIPPAVWLGLPVAVLLDTPVQLIWKWLAAHQAVVHGSPSARAVALLGEPALWILLSLFIVQFFNWLWVLANADLSFAQPFTALSYLTVSTGAAWLFHEHLTVGRMVGILVILVGVVLVGSTPHKTVNPA